MALLVYDLSFVSRNRVGVSNCGQNRVADRRAAVGALVGEAHGVLRGSVVDPRGPPAALPEGRIDLLARPGSRHAVTAARRSCDTYRSGAAALSASPSRATSAHHGSVSTRLRMSARVRATMEMTT